MFDDTPKPHLIRCVRIVRIREATTTNERISARNRKRDSSNERFTFIRCYGSNVRRRHVRDDRRRFVSTETRRRRSSIARRNESTFGGFFSSSTRSNVRGDRRDGRKFDVRRDAERRARERVDEFGKRSSFEERFDADRKRVDVEIRIRRNSILDRRTIRREFDLELTKRVRGRIRSKNDVRSKRETTRSRFRRTNTGAISRTTSRKFDDELTTIRDEAESFEKRRRSSERDERVASSTKTKRFGIADRRRTYFDRATNERRTNDALTRMSRRFRDDSRDPRNGDSARNTHSESFSNLRRRIDEDDERRTCSVSFSQTRDATSKINLIDFFANETFAKKRRLLNRLTNRARFGFEIFDRFEPPIRRRVDVRRKRDKRISRDDVEKLTSRKKRKTRNKKFSRRILNSRNGSEKNENFRFRPFERTKVLETPTNVFDGRRRLDDDSRIEVRNSKFDSNENEKDDSTRRIAVRPERLSPDDFETRRRRDDESKLTDDRSFGRISIEDENSLRSNDFDDRSKSTRFEVRFETGERTR